MTWRDLQLDILEEFADRTQLLHELYAKGLARRSAVRIEALARFCARHGVRQVQMRFTHSVDRQITKEAHRLGVSRSRVLTMAWREARRKGPIR